MRWNQKNERRGVILLVVLALLTLFAIVGISFVLYADAEAASARVAREAENPLRADVDPQQALAFFLGQLIYDVNDDVMGAGSGLRGHSLARGIYGYDSNADFSANKNLNVNPFNGVGRLHTNGNWPSMNPWSIDDNQLVNYTWFQVDKFVRNPEWYTNGVQNGDPSTAKAAGYYVGCNAPYTYPDLNNFFLAAIRSDGKVMAPSYHRPWLFGALDSSNANWTNAQGKYLTLRPRPNEHPGFPYPDDPTGDVKNLLGFPGGNDSIWVDLGAPVMTAPDGTQYKMLFAPLIMDLDNRINVNAVGNIVGTDGTNNNISLSNQGWFVSEVNLSTLWSNFPSPKNTEWQNLILGNKDINGTSYIARYGPDRPPVAAAPMPTAPLFPVGHAMHVYAQKDSDGRNETVKGSTNGQWCPPTGKILLPGTDVTNAPATTCFPYFPPGYGCDSTGERIVGGNGPIIAYRHPAAYAVYKPSLYTNTIYNTDYNPPVPPPTVLLIPNSNNDLVFQTHEMEGVLRFPSPGQPVDSGTSALISNMLRLCPQTLGTNLQLRNWITTISSDLARPAFSPWIYDPASSPPVVSATTPSLPPSAANATNFPSFNNRANVPPLGSDFTSDWRAASAALGRIDLNRPLPPYPHMSTSTTPMMTNTPNDRFDVASTAFPKVTDLTNQFLTATWARQQLALDIYTRLLAVTGVPLPSNVANPTAADLAPRRWLAQLAANIVDYIDADEISTPVNFYNPNNSPSGLPAPAGSFGNFQVTATSTNTIPYHPAPGGTGGNPDVPTYWVFGTEMPRVLINEVLGEYSLPTNNMNPPTTQNGTFNVNVWVELFNPMPTTSSVTNTQTANSNTLQAMDSLPVPLYMLGTSGGKTAAQGAYNPYQLVIANNNTAGNANGLWYDAAGGLNNNVLGTPLYNYYVNPNAATPVTAGCDFGAGIGEGNAGSAGTFAAPAAANYPLYPSGGNWGLYGGLPTAAAGQSPFLLVGPSTPALPSQPINDVNNDVTAAPGVPGTTPWVPSPNMQYQVTFTAPNQWSVTVPGSPFKPIPISDPTTGVSVLLRRLANPHLPPNPFKADGSGLIFGGLPPNPYITVDYVSGVPLNGYGSNGTNPVSMGGPTSPGSFGKLQPFAANLTLAGANQVDTTSSQYAFQTTAAGAVNHHTLGSPNSLLANPFTWLVHLDRNVISPMELLHVSGFHPHELTQRFIIPSTVPATPPATGTVPNPQLVPQPYNYTPAANVPANSTSFQHYVPWFDQTRRLYRLFEFLEAYNGASGVSSVNGRVPGKLNINTLWDQPSTTQQIVQAICDPPLAANADNANFTAANATSIFQALLANYRTSGLASGTLSASDAPFLGMGAGMISSGDSQYSAGLGINNTLFTSTVAATLPTTANAQGQGAQLQLPTSAPNAAAPSTTHPYLQNEMLTKIYSRLTTRSNAFAVFLTVGFFQVVGTVKDSPNIPQLGPELGRSEGRQVRHRMFAIVDRSQLAVFSTTSPTGVPTPPVTPGQIPWPVNQRTITLNFTNQSNQTYQTLTGASWLPAPGMQLVIEPGSVNEETVTVTSVGGGNGSPITVTADFLMQHPNQFVEGNPNLPPYVVIQRGNPGPWAPYDPRKDPLVVPYFAIID